MGLNDPKKVEILSYMHSFTNNKNEREIEIKFIKGILVSLGTLLITDWMFYFTMLH